MAYLIKQSESIATRSMVYLWCVQSNGSSAATHEVGGQPKFSIAGIAAVNSSGTLLDIDSASGLYAVTLSSSNVSLLGQGVVRYSSTTVPMAAAAFCVVGYDPYAALSTFSSSDSVGLKAQTHSAATIAGVTSGVTLLGGQYSNVSIGGVTLVTTTTTATTATNITNNHAKYAHGSVWIDSVNGSAGAATYTNGIQSNPVLAIADAKSIADNLLLKKFYVQARSNVTLVAGMAGYTFDGQNWILALGGQAITNSAFIGCKSVTGTASSSAAANTPLFSDCEFGAATIPASNLQRCQFSSTVTFVGGGNYDFIDCASVVAGTAAPVFDVNSVVNTNVSFRRWSGGITINNIAASTVVSIDAVSGGTVTLNGVDGNVQVRGLVTIVDNRTGTPTLGQNQALNRTVLATPTNITAGVITRVDSAVSLATGTWSGVTVGVDNIAPATYSGVTVGTTGGTFSLAPGTYSDVTVQINNLPAGTWSATTVSTNGGSFTLADGDYSAVTVRVGGIKAATYSGVTLGVDNIKPASYSGVTIAGVTSGVTLLGGQYSDVSIGGVTRVNSNVSLAAGTWSGVTVGVNNITAGSYSGVTIAGVTSGVTLLGGTYSNVTVQVNGGTVTAATSVTNPVTAGTVTDKTGYGLAAGDYSGATVGINNIAAGSYSGVTIAGVTRVNSSVTIANADYSAVTVRASNITISTGGIIAASFGAGAIDAVALATDAGQEFADAVLTRNVASGSDGGRTVASALYALRNKVAIDGSIGTVYQVNDSTSAWTFSVATVSTNSGLVNAVDPG